MSRYLTIAAFVWMFLALSSATAAEKCNLPLVFEDDFEKGSEHWQPTDASAWKIIETDRGKVYNQHKNIK